MLEVRKILGLRDLTMTEKALLINLNTTCIDKKKTISLIELSRELGITKPTLIKSLNTLIEKGFIEKNNLGKRYSKNIYLVKDLELTNIKKTGIKNFNLDKL